MNGRTKLRKSILEDSGIYNQHDRTVRVDRLKEDRPVRSLKVLILRRYPPRLVSSRKWTGYVAAACGRDDTGVVGLVLWDKQIDMVATGDVVLIQNGWCKRRMGERVVSTGRSGSLSVVGNQSL
ncbi:uncharacterized protein METZ01_LOCUS445359 [marine metagenome]|uniref:OB domain-containing protein n=1 Tax=marine metagenome TaxID=408172 RepID=A0A382ZBP7_9ZZZZ